MSHNRSALLGACLTLPLTLGVGAASAAQPADGHYVYVPAGAVVLVVPAEAAQPVDFPLARVIAEQQAMMHQMMAGMDALMATAMPDPQQMIRSVLAGAPSIGPGSGVIVRSFSSGNGSCSETITYGPGADGSQPVVKVAQTGNACGTVTPSAPSAPIEAAQPATPLTPAIIAPQPVPAHPHVWTISYPPSPVASPNRD
jgi:hypothetical protein